MRNARGARGVSVVVATAVGAALVLGPVASVQATGNDGSANRPEPEITFPQSALCVLPDAQNGWRPCVGVDRDALSYHDFYLIAGGKTLADDDEHRWWRRQILIASGVGVTVLGIVSLVPLAAGRRWIPLSISLGAIGGGIALTVLGNRVPQDPLIDAGEAADLARRYNARLRERLGVPPLRGTQVVLGLGLMRSF